MNLIERLKKLGERVAWMASLTGSHLSALVFWVSAARNLETIGAGSYQGARIVFRGLDTMALKEVLVDKEYAGVVERLISCDAPVVLDIGAHIGLFALSVIQANRRAHVLSVEADPETYSVLIQNMSSLRAQGADWDAVNAAAWCEDGKQLSFEGSGPSMSHRVSEAGTILVTTVTLQSLVDRMLEKHAQIDMMKIDVEGSEESFLCAAPELLRHVRCVVIELHPSLCDAKKVRDILAHTYGTIVELHDRRSSKPLLLCY